MGTINVKVIKDFVVNDKKRYPRVKPKGKEHHKTIIMKVKDLPYDNVLKYWRVLKYYTKRKYNLGEPELEVLIYLYDEHLFTREHFENFEGLLSWDKDRWYKLKRDGWIDVWRDHDAHPKQSLYMLSKKSRDMITSLYKKLYQEEPLGTKGRTNPIFEGQKPSCYQDKRYRKFIKKMNETGKEIRERNEKENPEE